MFGEAVTQKICIDQVSTFGKGASNVKFPSTFTHTCPFDQDESQNSELNALQSCIANR